MRQFYLAFRKSQTLSDELKNQHSKPVVSTDNISSFKLSWSHYLILMRIKNEDERNFYEIEAISNNWS